MELFKENLIDILIHEIGYIKSILDIPEMKIDITENNIVQELTEQYARVYKECQNNLGKEQKELFDD